MASSLTSLATTANPLPASPARAASMVALRASRLVWPAIEVMTLMTLPISALDSPSWATVVLVLSATVTAAVATLAASAAFLAISLMLAPISSAPVATVCTFVLTCSAPAETMLAWAGGFLGGRPICWLSASNSSDTEPRPWAVPPALSSTSPSRAVISSRCFAAATFSVTICHDISGPRYWPSWPMTAKAFNSRDSGPT